MSAQERGAGLIDHDPEVSVGVPQAVLMMPLHRGRLARPDPRPAHRRRRHRPHPS
ncbi:hypothetical protein [Nonomuraea bangladeshensis]|uniref:hypothetical protein n=1 Tax=Nonomuraea bangladeshensis TaxID=404385 RepID=UPI003C2D6C44